ncbi:tyrosine-type recombinase/integrase [Carnobacterium maltaromaticum]|uniref:Tyrosine-type recombinase/integrase n=1 Tax=Carnobacterium maltaromaticum TaxID=2751 RepID=A0AAW9K8H7_CARML|nr:tyrosine-type recombinase/integrase [Carnobacterium maltaromaticum]MDZ5759782.1 tyrosine-type recombinase/integrase [Carnobacterium maltaromaticum]
MIKKIADNNYSVYVSLGYNPLTKSYERFRRQGIATRSEAENIETEALNQKRGKKLLTKSKFSINDIATSYFTNYSHQNKANYIKLQKGYLKNHINPFFRDTNIKDLQLKDIQLFQQKMLQKENKQTKKKLDSKTINKVFIFLSQIFDVAVKENVIPYSPTEHIQKLREEKKEMNFWTLQEYKDFISRIREDEPHIKIFFQTDYFTGARGGEMISLKWNQHFNEHTKEIFIEKTSYVEKKEVITTGVKTKSSLRRVTLNQKLFEALLEWKKKQKIILENLGVDYKENEIYIFQYSELSPRRDYFYRQIKKICNRGDVPMQNIRLHDFRHSHVAYIIDKGEEPVLIKERLGHASITTTIDTYGHLYPNKQKETSDKFDSDF